MSDEKLTPEAATTEVAASQNTVPETTMPDGSDGWLLAERVCWHLLEKKGTDLVILDLRGRSDVCDFFVLASGNSDVQVRALAKNVQDQLVSIKQKTAGIEGVNEGRWALLDYFDVVVHIFQEEVRDYFQMERLWGDAGRIDILPEWFTSEEVTKRHPDLNFTTAANFGDAD